MKNLLSILMICLLLSSVKGLFYGCQYTCSGGENVSTGKQCLSTSLTVPIEEEIHPTMTELDVLDMCNNKDGIEYIIAADYCLSEINNCQPPDPKAFERQTKLIFYVPMRLFR